jgi:hypothetical protein
MATKIQVRRDSSADWNITNPILSEGEIGFETNTGKFKIGNGSSVWSGLEYFDVEVDLSEYLTLFSASTTYLTQASASTNYLTQYSASTTYLTQSSASTTYAKKASPVFTGNVSLPVDTYIGNLVLDTAWENVNIPGMPIADFTSQSIELRYKQIGKTVFFSFAFYGVPTSGSNKSFMIPLGSTPPAPYYGEGISAPSFSAYAERSGTYTQLIAFYNTGYPGIEVRTAASSTWVTPGGPGIYVRVNGSYETSASQPL